MIKNLKLLLYHAQALKRFYVLSLYYLFFLRIGIIVTKKSCNKLNNRLQKNSWDHWESHQASIWGENWLPTSDKISNARRSDFGWKYYIRGNSRRQKWVDTHWECDGKWSSRRPRQIPQNLWKLSCWLVYNLHYIFSN